VEVDLFCIFVILSIGEKMKLQYKNKCIELYECKTFFDRFRGFMFTKTIDKALLFDNCNSIHTFFMLKNIDVILCDKNNKILHYYNNFKRNRIILPKKNVVKIYETPTSYFNIKTEDYMEVIK